MCQVNETASVTISACHLTHHTVCRIPSSPAGVLGRGYRRIHLVSVAAAITEIPNPGRSRRIAGGGTHQSDESNTEGDARTLAGPFPWCAVTPGRGPRTGTIPALDRMRSPKRRPQLSPHQGPAMPRNIFACMQQNQRWEAHPLGRELRLSPRQANQSTVWKDSIAR